MDDGLISLGTPVRSVLPGLPRWVEPIRTGHLIAHTSGLPDYEDLVPPDAPQLTDRDVVRILSESSGGVFLPGSRFRYSDTGYVVLAVLIEEVTGRAFGQVLEERMFGPLGMAGTVAHVEGVTIVPERAYGYRPEGDGFADADQGATTATLGDGGVYSSIRDLARWEAALREPGFQPDAAALDPFAPAAARAGDSAEAYGFGWFLDTFRGRRRQRHQGWSTGFQNEIQRFPGSGLTVIMLTNRSTPPVRPIVESVVELFDPGPER